jgi:integrase
MGRHIESKNEALTEVERIRTQIRAGVYRVQPVSLTLVSPPSPTLDAFASIYIERSAKQSGKRTWKNDEYRLACLCNHRAADGRRLGEYALLSITEDEVEAFFSARRATGLAASTLNHDVQLLKATFRWAAKKGYLARNPISEDSSLRRSRLAQRSRRISADEERALLTAAATLDSDAGLRLSGLIIAALETGCRRGELLGLQWSDVSLERHELLIRAENAKDAEFRRLPISTRLAAVLAMAQTDPAGRTYPSTAFVFGALGRRVGAIRKAWEICVLRAYGHGPKWVKNGRNTLAPESRSTLRAIDLHFHDLRHEAGSRWLEAGWPIHHVKQMLGHANISQTDTYLNAGRMGLHESMKRFDAIRCTTVAHEPRLEQRPLSNADSRHPANDLLH